MKKSLGLFLAIVMILSIGIVHGSAAAEPEYTLSLDASYPIFLRPEGYPYNGVLWMEPFFIEDSNGWVADVEEFEYIITDEYGVLFASGISTVGDPIITSDDYITGTLEVKVLHNNSWVTGEAEVYWVTIPPK